MEKIIGNLTIHIYQDGRVSITKRYNPVVEKEITFNMDETYDLEYAIKWIRREWEI